MSHSKVYDELLPESDDNPATEPASKPEGDGIKIITLSEVSKYHDHIEALRRELSMNCTFIEQSFEEMNLKERQIEDLKKRFVWLESKIIRLRGIVSKYMQCSKCNPPAAADKKTAS